MAKIIFPDIAADQLYGFIDRAHQASYAGGGSEVEAVERPMFAELVYFEGALSYRDSYSGHYRARGMEVVRYKDVPIWAMSYGGGIVAGKEDLDEQIIAFLKKAMLAKETGFDSLRGPHKFVFEEWSYTYNQKGNIWEFSGSEEIKLRGQLVFSHHNIGGKIDHRTEVFER